MRKWREKNELKIFRKFWWKVYFSNIIFGFCLIICKLLKINFGGTNTQAYLGSASVMRKRVADMKIDDSNSAAAFGDKHSSLFRRSFSDEEKIH